ncbi:MAG: ABC transporter ATP-binding protein, partial [Anaerolineales bacterium]|nr:ABC transporter ATP-binding protein [Anaerolineales bacterium]
MNVIEVQNLRKKYGSTVAVDNISFNVQQGEIFTIVGPNGAGKSTTVESIMGLRQPDGGTIRVLGLDPQKDEQELRQRIGIQLQQAALPERLKVWEALNLYSSFYEKTVPWEKLLEDWGLTEKRNANFKNLSGGQKQRL